MFSYRLPNGAVPLLVSSDSVALLREDAAALARYVAAHPKVTPQDVTGMLFRTRPARKHRALVMAGSRDDMLGALRSVAEGGGHPSVVRNGIPATGRTAAFVFPGQGGQRPGMGRLWYESVPAYRAEADRCAEAFRARGGESPLDYLLDELPDEQRRAGDVAHVVQPALFTQMAGLAAAWRSFGVTPAVTVGHSQGELAAACTSGVMTLTDAVRTVDIRARTVDGIESDDYAMAVVAADRDTCADLLARCLGWAELSVVNSPGMTGISGERSAVRSIVDTLSARGVFARIIGVHYPAHTSLINRVGDAVRAAVRSELEHVRFLEADITCVGATLGGPVTPDLLLDRYWFWNLRNTVRFDRAIEAALALGADTFVELAEHPTLQSAIQENLARPDDGGSTLVVSSSRRDATGLDAFTHSLAVLAVHDSGYRWECLRVDVDGPRPIPLPLPDFPHARMNEVRLWLPYQDAAPQQDATAGDQAAGADGPMRAALPRRLTEQWIRLTHRALVPPRVMGVIDHTGGCAELATALCAAADDVGATARIIDTHRTGTDTAGLDTYVILVPQFTGPDECAAAAAVSRFFAERAWWPGLAGTVTDCWLVTAGGEAALTGDPPPDPVGAGISAGFRCIGAEHPGVSFRHLDLPPGPMRADAVPAVLSALHTEEEPELALRGAGLYAKRIVTDPAGDGEHTARPTPRHVLITGGTGNLGLELCEHFAGRGAQRITLVSRSGGNAAVAERLRHIRSGTGTRITAAGCDVADPAAVSRLAEQHRDTPADLIVHAALAYSDAELADITADQADRVLGAKVAGIVRLLDAFPRTDDCRVLLCSSVAATIGGRGQIVYAAANRMLDAIAYRLRVDGLDCVSVQWGQWTVHFDLDDAGWAKLAATGLLPMRPADAMAAGLAPLDRNTVVAGFDLSRARPVLSAYGYRPLLSGLADTAAAVPAATSGADLQQRLMRLLATTVGVEGDHGIDPAVPMVAIGLDSLQALEFRRLVKTELNHDLDVSELLGGASIADVLVRLGG